MPDKRPRGLGSLIASTRHGAARAPGDVRLVDVPVAAIVPSPRQPRRTFDREALESLAESIRQHGLLQPVIVRPTGSKFELIAGERRWRAAKLAGLEVIRAVSKPAGDAETLTLSIIENLQREDLDPIEEATAYRALTEELDLPHEQVAAHVGKDRTTITNMLRLLELPSGIQAKLASGALSQGHARVLLAVADPARQTALAERAARLGMSVRALEKLVYGDRGGARAAGRRDKPAHIQDLERRLRERLGVAVEIRERRRGGQLVITFRSNQEFIKILETMGVDTLEV